MKMYSPERNCGNMSDSNVDNKMKLNNIEYNSSGVEDIKHPQRELDIKDREAVALVLSDKPIKLVLSNPQDKSYIYKKTVIQSFYNKNIMHYQVERFTEKQAFHENIEVNKLSEVVLDAFPSCYKQLNVFLEDGDVDYKVTKKGKLLSNRHKETSKLKRGNSYSSTECSVKDNTRGNIHSNTHNRRKNYILEEGMVVPPLVDLGIFTKDGKVVNSMYDKYKQINRFIELVDDVIKKYPCEKELNIIDFGCGKSYLTFILYYYLVCICGLKVTMTGLDLKADVIEKCNATAKKYHYDNLHFELGDINGYKTDKPVDMVVTLHACDTATDYALYNAIKWNAGIIMSVPCCQHELNSQIQSEDYNILTRYGIVKERVSALMTDAIRANVLEYCGYHTQLLEFIDIAHSPKNILIRAVKNNSGRVIEYSDGKTLVENSNKGNGNMTCWKEAERLCQEFHLKQKLMELVKGDKV